MRNNFNRLDSSFNNVDMNLNLKENKQIKANLKNTNDSKFQEFNNSKNNFLNAKNKNLNELVKTFIFKENINSNIAINSEIDKFNENTDINNINKNLNEFSKIYSLKKYKRENKSDSENDFCFDLHLKDGKDYLIENDKLIILTNNPDEKTKKEIRILRNRISAQKSRDRKKNELREFKEFSNILYNENQYLKCKINEKEEETEGLKKHIRNYENNLCDQCQYLKNFKEIKIKSDDAIRKKSNITNKSYNIHNLNNKDSFTSQNTINLSDQINPPSLIDISVATRRNFSNNIKIGVFSGLLVIFFVLSCVLWGQFDEINMKITRKLFSFYDGKLVNSIMKNQDPENKDIKSLPDNRWF